MLVASASVAICLLRSAAVLVVASFCDGGALLVAGIVNGVARVGVCRADAGVLHSPVVVDCICEAQHAFWLPVL